MCEGKSSVKISRVDNTFFALSRSNDVGSSEVIRAAPYN